MERMKAACEKVLEKAVEPLACDSQDVGRRGGEEEQNEGCLELLSSTDKTSDGEFNVDAVVEKLGEKFGLESKAGEKRKAGPEEEDASDNSADVKDDSGEEEAPSRRRNQRRFQRR